MNRTPAPTARNPVWIRFMCPVNATTITSLLKCVDQAIASRCDHLHLLISSNGGSVFHGISAHNYLKGLGIGITTYNFGSADSIATVMFCAGNQRLCAPHARFLIHPVSMQISNTGTYQDKDLDEFIKNLRIDSQNIARVIADTTGRDLKHVENDMHVRTTLNPNEALQYGACGLVTDIRQTLYGGGQMFAIYENGEIFHCPQPAPATPPQSA